MDNPDAGRPIRRMLPGMTFSDLPPDVRDRSLDDRRIATDLVDACCLPSDRMSGALTVLVTDDRHRMVQPFTVSGAPRHCTSGDGQLVFGPLIALAAQFSGAVVVAVGKPPGRVDDDDRAWHQLAVDACRTAGVPLLGFYVAAGSQITRLPDPVPV